MRRNIQISSAVISALLLLSLLPAVSASIPDSAKAAIAKEVRHELVTLPYYGVFDNLAFRVDDDGTVALLGQMPRPVLKDDAERVVRSGCMRILLRGRDERRLRPLEIPGLPRYAGI